LRGGLLRTACGAEILTRAVSDLAAEDIDTLLVAAQCGASVSAEARDWVAANARRARRIGATNGGGFLLAAAGLLDHRRATTHWSRNAELGAFPGVKVESDALYVEDGDVWTSAGVSAGLDMALQMIERDFGTALAVCTARQLALKLKRSGEEPQVSAWLDAQAIPDDRLRELVQWILDNPQADLDVRALADRAHMSARSLFRAFATHIGVTPREFAERARLEAARRFLESSGNRLDYVAQKAGFGTTESMRRAFRRTFNQTPGAYRHACRSSQNPSRFWSSPEARVTT
jgi:transcriptional regulator GlxA family with amidase domain